MSIVAAPIKLIGVDCVSSNPRQIIKLLGVDREAAAPIKIIGVDCASSNTNQVIKLLGVDIGFCNTGIARCLLNTITGEIDILKNGLYLITPPTITKKELAKAKLSKSGDNLRRASAISAALAPHMEWCDYAAVEIPSGARSATALYGFGICVGVLAQYSHKVINLTPLDVKKAGAGKGADKDAMIAWASEMYPNLNWIKTKKGGMVGRNEHLADAVGCAHAAINKIL